MYNQQRPNHGVSLRKSRLDTRGAPSKMQSSPRLPSPLLKVFNNPTHNSMSKMDMNNVWTTILVQYVQHSLHRFQSTPLPKTLEL
jgi:hypothetical protein